MYVTQRRYSAYSEPIRGEYRGIATKWENAALRERQYYQVPAFVESVYSWRTGARAVSSPPVSRSTTGIDGWGLKTPPNSGSLVDRLSARKNYIEEVQRAAFPAETQSGSVSTDRTSTADSGHLFATVKCSRGLIRGESSYYFDGYHFRGDVVMSPANIPVNDTPFPTAFPRETTVSGAPSQSDLQGLANRYFASTAPDRNEASLGVTLVELLRGDIPSVLKNFRKMMTDSQSVGKTLGSDYLNITFGWTPLINEAANIIKIGMTLDRAVYYETFRRKRRWDGPVTSNRQTVVQGISSLAPHQAGTFPRDIAGVPGNNGYGAVSYNVDERILVSEDYHWSSRYSGLAKPTLKANSHNDRAMEIVKRLGLVDDPRFLWDLMPYSWLVDWFTTMGASISNARTYSPKSGKYSVDYAYMTTKRLRAREWSIIGYNVPPSSRIKSHRLYNSRTSSYNTSLWRSRATPFGFGTQLGSLNGSQYAILVALGLARGR